MVPRPAITRAGANADPEFVHKALQPKRRQQRRSEQKQARETVYAANREGKVVAHFGAEHVTGVQTCQETVNSTCVKLTECADQIEQLKTGTQADLSETILGDLEAFVGKARLLVKSKLQKQFQTMLNDALDPLYQPPTKVSDLTGFWEMVEIQVDQAMEDYKRILKLKANNWREAEPAPGPKSKILKPKNKPAVSAKQSAKSAEAAKQRAEKMKAFKAEMKAKQQQQEEEGDENVAIF